MPPLKRKRWQEDEEAWCRYTQMKLYKRQCVAEFSARYGHDDPSEDVPGKRAYSGIEYVHMLEWPVFKHLDLQQREHTLLLADYTDHHVTIIDNSEAGCGKTWIPFGIAEQLKFRSQDPGTPFNLFVFSVKAVLNEFANLAKKQGFESSVHLLGCANPDLAIRGKYMAWCARSQSLVQAMNPYVTVIDTRESKRRFQCQFPPRTLIVFDEAHLARNTTSGAFQMLDALLKSVAHLQVHDIPFKLLLSTATLLENYIKHVPVIMYFTRMIPQPSLNLAHAILWEPRLRSSLMHSFGVGTETYASDHMSIYVLHHLLFNHTYPCAHRMTLRETMACRQGLTIETLTNADGQVNHSRVPLLKNDIKIVAFQMSDEDRGAIQESVEQLWTCALQQQSGIPISSWQFRLLPKLRSLTEHHRIPCLLEITRDAIDSGLSVILMLNFRASLTLFVDRWTSKYSAEGISRIYGGQKAQERELNIRAFQVNTNRVCVAMSQAGGVGISLHDTMDMYPRLELISPNYSSTNWIQEEGRGFRNTSKSNTLTWIVTCKETIEEHICRQMKPKFEQLDLLNNGRYSDVTRQRFFNDISLEQRISQMREQDRVKFTALLDKTRHRMQE